MNKIKMTGNFVSFMLAGLVILKHRPNIGRLLSGTESRFWGAKP